MKQAWIMTHKQTGERRILPESEAFDLDKRLWIMSRWTVTEKGERPPRTVCFTPRVYETQQLSHKCIHCGSYIPHDVRNCHRPQHQRIA